MNKLKLQNNLDVETFSVTVNELPGQRTGHLIAKAISMTHKSSKHGKQNSTYFRFITCREEEGNASAMNSLLPTCWSR